MIKMIQLNAWYEKLSRLSELMSSLPNGLLYCFVKKNVVTKVYGSVDKMNMIVNVTIVKVIVFLRSFRAIDWENERFLGPLRSARHNNMPFIKTSKHIGTNE